MANDGKTESEDLDGMVLRRHGKTIRRLAAPVSIFLFVLVTHWSFLPDGWKVLFGFGKADILETDPIYSRDALWRMHEGVWAIAFLTGSFVSICVILILERRERSESKS